MDQSNYQSNEPETEISLTELSEKVDQLQEDVSKILILLESTVKNNCDKNGEHIDFIEDVYTKVKYPLEYVADKINNTRRMIPSLVSQS